MLKTQSVSSRKPSHPGLRYRAKKLRFEDELALFILLARFVGFVVLPADRLFALSTVYIADDVASGSHVALVRFRLGDVDDLIEEVCLAVLPTEVLGKVNSDATCLELLVHIPCLECRRGWRDGSCRSGSRRCGLR